MGKEIIGSRNMDDLAKTPEFPYCKQISFLVDEFRQMILTITAQDIGYSLFPYVGANFLLKFSSTVC
ncbi:hypothetical protein MKW98_029431, partial [Papaver atlanticum]